MKAGSKAISDFWLDLRLKASAQKLTHRIIFGQFWYCLNHFRYNNITASEGPIVGSVIGVARSKSSFWVAPKSIVNIESGDGWDWRGRNISRGRRGNPTNERRRGKFWLLISSEMRREEGRSQQSITPLSTAANGRGREWLPSKEMSLCSSAKFCFLYKLDTVH